MSSQAALHAFPSVSELVLHLRKYILQAQSDALKRHGIFQVAISGGSLPNTVAKALLSPNDDGDGPQWDKWEIFFADERAVPLDHEDSNFRLVKEELLDKISDTSSKPIVHPIDIKYLDDLPELADQYGEALVRSFAAKDSVKIPVFDLILLGCGPDGHTCSLFPGHDLLREKEAWTASIEDSPKPPPKRITLTLPVVSHGLKIAFVATGQGKKGVMKQIFDDPEGQGLPCALVNSSGGDRVSWFTDEPAVEGVAYRRRASLI
ncbi:MAG: suppressor of los1-1 [Vezdaea aestivalis]|nr:MAG: suppressor of los1-1 [Vezdaea aestivalis]